MKTRAELIEGLTTLQLDRLNGSVSKRPYKGAWTPQTEDEHYTKSYFKYHDSNCKLHTQEIKRRIMQELIWKSRKGMNYGTQTKV